MRGGVLTGTQARPREMRERGDWGNRANPGFGSLVAFAEWGKQLLADAQLADDVAVAVGVVELEIVEQTAALGHQH